jgi:hypothetical protein
VKPLPIDPQAVLLMHQHNLTCETQNLLIPVSTFRAQRQSCPCAQVIKHYAMKTHGGVDVYIHVFLTSALVGDKWSASRPGRHTPGTHWVGPRTDLDDVEIYHLLYEGGLLSLWLYTEVRKEVVVRRGQIR